MRIKSTELSTEMRITLTGTETWLGALYADFASSEPPSTSRLLTGHLDLTKAENGSVNVKGSLSFTPIVSCARCAKDIPWPLAVPVDTVVLPEDHAPLPKDHNLREEELESYRLIGDEVDLELLVNDAVQTALPNQFVAASEDGKSCKICHLDISNPKVFSAGESEQASPFAALRGLKVPT